MKITDDELLKAEEMAARMNTTVGTLGVWRCKGKGPPFIKKGRWIRYSLHDYNAWVAAGRVTPASPATSQAGA